MGASASRRDARGIVMSMGRDSAMGQKVRFRPLSNRHLNRNQAKASHTPPSTRWPAAVRDFWQARNVAPVVSTSSTKTTSWPQATVSPDTDSNIPSSESNRSPRVASVKEDRCRIRRNVVEDMSRFHALASPSHNASDGLNPRRQTRRQWDGTGINVVFTGGARQRLPIHMPSVLTMFGKTPILHAMNHGFRGWSKPEPQSKNWEPRTLLRKDAAREVICQRRPLPAARRAHPSHFVGQQRLSA